MTRMLNRLNIPEDEALSKSNGTDTDRNGGGISKSLFSSESRSSVSSSEGKVTPGETALEVPFLSMTKDFTLALVPKRQSQSSTSESKETPSPENGSLEPETESQGEKTVGENQENVFSSESQENEKSAESLSLQESVESEQEVVEELGETKAKSEVSSSTVIEGACNVKAEASNLLSQATTTETVPEAENAKQTEATFTEGNATSTEEELKAVETVTVTPAALVEIAERVVNNNTEDSPQPGITENVSSQNQPQTSDTPTVVVSGNLDDAVEVKSADEKESCGSNAVATESEESENQAERNTEGLSKDSSKTETALERPNQLNVGLVPQATGPAAGEVTPDPAEAMAVLQQAIADMEVDSPTSDDSAAVATAETGSEECEETPADDSESERNKMTDQDSERDETSKGEGSENMEVSRVESRQKAADQGDESGETAVENENAALVQQESTGDLLSQQNESASGDSKGEPAETELPEVGESCVDSPESGSDAGEVDSCSAGDLGKECDTVDESPAQGQGHSDREETVDQQISNDLNRSSPEPDTTATSSENSSVEKSETQPTARSDNTDSKNNIKSETSDNDTAATSENADSENIKCDETPDKDTAATSTNMDSENINSETPDKDTAATSDNTDSENINSTTPDKDSAVASESSGSENISSETPHKQGEELKDRREASTDSSDSSSPSESTTAVADPQNEDKTRVEDNPTQTSGDDSDGNTNNSNNKGGSRKGSFSETSV